MYKESSPGGGRRKAGCEGQEEGQGEGGLEGGMRLSYMS